MAEVGSYYITIMPEMSKFTGAVKGALGDVGTSAGNSFSRSFSDVLKGSAIGTMVGSFATQLGGKLMSGISTGINRLDTLENFPRVMEAFGYSADDASAAVNNIMEHLRGLPTASQDVVALTQAISDSTGDLDLASRAALGFNDMMLAGGASTQDMATATGVLNRILGKGSATTQQWNSLMAVMPKQLDLVAESMLGTGASSWDLYAALEDGTVSYNDFLRAIVKLDEEGTAATKSFYDQAKANSIGIGSAIENIGNRIGAGWANVFKAIGQQEIHDVLEGVADAIKAPLDALANGIAYLKEKIGETSIMENAATVFKKIGEAISGVWNDGGPDMLKALADGLVSLTDGALKWLADNGDLVTTAVWGMVGALAALAGWKIGTALATLPTVLTGITAALSANPFVLIVGGVIALAAALYGFFTQTEEGKAIWQNFCQLLSDLWTGLQEDWAVLTSTLSREWQSFQDFINGIPEWWKGIKEYWANALAEQAENFRVSWEKIRSDLTAAWEGIKATLAGVIEGIRSNITTTLENIKTTALQVWENIKTGASTAWNAIRSTVTGIVDGLRSTVTGAFEGIRSTVTSIWNGIKESISNAINGAKDAVSSAIETIKGLFNFQISWPHIPLPHFSVSGSPNPLDWLTSGPPSISVDWYAKGGLFTRPTIAGLGEAGDEAALPLNDSVYARIAQGIASQMGSGGGDVILTGNYFVIREEADIDRIAERLNQKIARERASERVSAA